jgi:hypothetical protein
MLLSCYIGIDSAGSFGADRGLGGPDLPPGRQTPVTRARGSGDSLRHRVSPNGSDRAETELAGIPAGGWATKGKEQIPFPDSGIRTDQGTTGVARFRYTEAPAARDARRSTQDRIVPE